MCSSGRGHPCERRRRCTPGRPRAWADSRTRPGRARPGSAGVAGIGAQRGVAQVLLGAGQHLGDGHVAAELGASARSRRRRRCRTGTMRSYQDRSQSQLRAKPCIVTPRLTRMPMARDLAVRARGRRRRTQTPLRPSTRAVVDAEVGAHADQRLLEPAHVGDDVDGVGQPHDRVADELARAVPGDLAAAVDVDDRGAVEAGARAARCACRRCRPAGARAAARCRARSPATTAAWTPRWRSQAAV